MQHDSPNGVHFTPGETGSSLFRAALAEATQRHPEVFAGIEVPGPGKAFKAALPEFIVQFEARRAGAPDRTDIARTLVGALERHARLGDAPLADALKDGPSEAVEQTGTGSVGWTPEVSYRGQTYRGAAIGELAQRMRADHQLTTGAARALGWVADTLLDGPIDLSDHRFALFGAGAELAPTHYLLQAGARVLWVDQRPPEPKNPGGWSGTLVHHPGASDLLLDPGAIYRAVAAEAEAGPLHLGMYAYAPGKGRELLLTSAMNAIATRLDASRLHSIAMLVSPTTPGELDDDDRADQRARRDAAPRWQGALRKLRLISEPPSHVDGGADIARSIVGLQGPTYLAAQYLAKMMLAEAWAADRGSVRVSANVAGITHTKSLEHPLFLAGFIGGAAFGIEVFQPEQTRVLTTLMMLHDVLNPAAPGADDTGGPSARARRITSQAIHGGVRTAPWGFWGIIQASAVIGLAQRPGLLVGRR